MRRGPDLFAALGFVLIAGTATSDTAYVTCQNGNTLGVIDVANARQTDRWSVPGNPAGVAVSDMGDVYTVSPES